MSRKSIGLLVCTILIFLLVASAMAIENKSANETFTNPNSTVKSINSSVVGSALADSDADNRQINAVSGIERQNPSSPDIKTGFKL